MILAALAPAFAALSIFFATVFPKKRRWLTEAECQSASGRAFDGPRAAKTLLVVGLVAWSLLVITAVHLIVGHTDWMPTELA